MLLLKMSMLKCYYDLMSQPSRAVYIFLKLNKVPFESKPVALRKGEHFGDEFRKVNPFSRVPVIDDNGFILTESVAILNYLVKKFNLPDHWYPQHDVQKRARVEEYAHWQHTNTRINCAFVFQHMVLLPQLRQKPIDWDQVKKFKSGVSTVVEHLENYFLKERKYIAGDQISIADLLCICELMQLTMVDEQKLFESNAVVKAWVDRVVADLNPEFEEGHVVVRRSRKPILERLSKM